MPKGSPEHTRARREEIINACEELYKTRSFKEITMKEIAEATSFTRPSLYNYFQTREEIFLALLQREYELWIHAMETAMDSHETMSREEFAGMLAKTLEERPQLLKILSMNHYDMESGSRLERLTEFKRIYGLSMKTVHHGLDRYFPQLSESEKQQFIYTFFPFLFGVYAYTYVTEPQRIAMEEADVHYVFMSIYEIIYQCVCGLLGVHDSHLPEHHE